MKNIIKLELNKAIKNKFFLFSVIIGCIITLISFVYHVQQYQSNLAMEKEFLEMTTVQANPLTAINTLFNHWIGGEAFSLGSTIYFFVFPLLIAIPYGWSYCEEKKSGYIRSVVVRSGKFSYFVSKNIALFISGGLTMLLPLIFNLLLTAMVFPAVTPNVLYSTSYGVFGQSLMSVLYYSKPFLYVFIYLCLDFVFCGLLACLCFAVSVFIKQRVAVVILPFIIVLALQYTSTLISFPMLQDKELSPLYFLRPVQAGLNASWTIIITESVFLFLVTVTITIIWERRHEIY